MKAHIVIVAEIFSFLTFIQTRDVIINYAEYEPIKSEFMDYGSFKLMKNRQTREFIVKGNFTLYQNVGNEKIVIVDIYRGAVRLTRMQYPFCEYMQRDTVFWPDLLKNSDFPKNNPCPFPSVRVTQFNIQGMKHI